MAHKYNDLLQCTALNKAYTQLTFSSLLTLPVVVFIQIWYTRDDEVMKINLIRELGLILIEKSWCFWLLFFYVYADVTVF